MKKIGRQEMCLNTPTEFLLNSDTVSVASLLGFCVGIGVGPGLLMLLLWSLHVCVSVFKF